MSLQGGEAPAADPDAGQAANRKAGKKQEQSQRETQRAAAKAAAQAEAAPWQSLPCRCIPEIKCESDLSCMQHIME